MAKKLGYGGIGNTNGARDFSGKEAAVFTGGRSHILVLLGDAGPGTMCRPLIARPLQVLRSLLWLLLLR